MKRTTSIYDILDQNQQDKYHVFDLGLSFPQCFEEPDGCSINYQ